MRFIGTRVHGILDYSSGILLLASPWLLGFANGTAAQWVPVAVGVLVIMQSLLTDYEMGAVRKIPMTVHLSMDVMSGAVLAISPWLFNFSDEIWWPHLAIGLFSVIAGMTTQKLPERKSNIA